MARSAHHSDRHAARHADSWRHRFGHSTKWRLVALFLLLALGVSGAFLYGMQKALAGGWRDAVKPMLANYVDRLAADIGSPPDLVKAQALVARLPISIRISGPTVQFDSHPEQTLRWARSRDSERDGIRLLERRTADGHTLRFGLGELNWRHGPGNVVWITLSALLLLTAVAYLYVRRLLKPLEDIGAGARRIGAGDFSQPIRVRRRDDLGELAGQINTMGQDIHQMLEAKRGLLLAISHELRSPLTRARLNAELLPEEAQTSATRAAIQRDLIEMGRLIADLLESERLSSRHGALQCEAVDVAALAHEVVAHLNTESIFAGVAQARIKVVMAPNLPRMQLDPVRIRLLLRNLLDNALRYAAADAPPCELAVHCADKQLAITVRDYGPGVDATQLPHLMQAFYRPDASRQRSTGGVGLGLYLCQLVAHAHGGSLTLANASPGLLATIRLPVVT